MPRERRWRQGTVDELARVMYDSDVNDGGDFDKAHPISKRLYKKAAKRIIEWQRRQVYEQAAGNQVHARDQETP